MTLGIDFDQKKKKKKTLGNSKFAVSLHHHGKRKLIIQ